MIELRRYVSANGQDVIGKWLAKFRDRQARARIETRLTRLSLEYFGDCKPVRAGVWELRIDAGPGYRVCYARESTTIILLLCGGDKNSQSRDIERAVE